MTEAETDFDAENPYDIFEEGQEIPWESGTATVVDIERGLDEYPEKEWPHDVGKPFQRERSPVKWPITLVTLQDTDGDEFIASAEYVNDRMGVAFNQRGLPAIKAFGSLMDFDGAKIVPPSDEFLSASRISVEEANELAEFFREHADFEPLYAFIGNVSGPEEMHAMADALENVALAREMRQREP